MKNEEFRKYAHQMVDWIADYSQKAQPLRQEYSTLLFK